MAAAFFLSAAWICSFVGIFRLEKTKNTLSAPVWIVLTALINAAVGGVLAGIVSVVHIPVNLVSMGVIYILTALFVFYRQYRTKKSQSYWWSWRDAVFLAAFAAAAVCVACILWGGTFEFHFKNSDAAVHVQNAMYIVDSGRVSGMYFPSLYLALLIEMARPVLAQAMFYKMFILADVVSLFFQTALFYLVLRRYLTSVRRSLFGAAVTLLYMAGYPLMNTELSFFYWGTGVLFLTFTLLMVQYYKTETVERSFCVFAMMLGCAGIFLDYMLFAPVAYLAVLFSLILITKQEGERIFTLYNVGLALQVFFIPCALGMYHCFFGWIVSTGISVKGQLQTDGGIYAELYIGFLLLFPFIIYWFLRCIARCELDEFFVFFICFMAFALLLFVLRMAGLVSTYYYYKIYFPLWLLSMLIMVFGVTGMWQREKTALVSLTAVVAFLAVINYSGLEKQVIKRTTLTETRYAHSFFDLYGFTYTFLNGDSDYEAGLVELCDYTNTVLEKGVTAPLLADQETYGYAYWYDALTDQSSSAYYGWYVAFDELEKKIRKGDCDYIVVLKKSGIYESHKDFFSEYPVVMENETGAVLRIPF